MMYKVKNISPDVRKFTRKGKKILINPNRFILTEYPPKECSVWEITVEETHIEKVQNEKIHIEKKDKRKLNRRNKK